MDLESGTILGVTVQGGSKGDTESFGETLDARPSSWSESAPGDDRLDPGDQLPTRASRQQPGSRPTIDELGLRSYIAGDGPWSSSLEP